MLMRISKPAGSNRTNATSQVVGLLFSLIPFVWMAQECLGLRPRDACCPVYLHDANLLLSLFLAISLSLLLARQRIAATNRNKVKTQKGSLTNVGAT